MNPLHIEFRPQSFDEFIGNEVVVKSLLSSLSRTQTYLLHGQRGCGKTTLARLIAQKLKINKNDIYEIDAADKTGIDDARQLKVNASLAPLSGNKKIYILDECHRLSGNSMDSLLKILEEPPKHCYFVLCTTDPAKVSATIKSRSKMYEVKPLKDKDAFKLLDWICDEEKIKISDKVKDAIVDECKGIPREIVIALDSIRDIDDEDEAIELIQSEKENPQIIDLCRFFTNTFYFNERHIKLIM